MHAEWLPCTVCLPSLVLIAQAVFLLNADPYTQSHRCKWSPCGVQAYNRGQRAEPPVGFRAKPSTPSWVKTHRICINLRNDLWQKWGGHVHPMVTPLLIKLTIHQTSDCMHQINSSIVTWAHTQPFYSSVDFVRGNPGELISEETFTHSHLSWSPIVPYLLPPSTMIHGILSVQSMQNNNYNCIVDLLMLHSFNHFRAEIKHYLVTSIEISR